MFFESNLVSIDLVKQELDQILLSRGFATSPTLTKFLRFIVEHTLAGKQQQIKEYTVGIAVLNKKASFNPMLDASVRIHAVRLRKSLTEYYNENNPQASVRIELPKGSYVPVFTAWAPGDGANQQEFLPGTIANSKHIDYGSVCVIPFKGFINYEAPDFSVHGFCQFLTEKLSLFQDIAVLSYHSAFRFFNEGGNVADLGKTLGVGYYVSGSVELDGANFLVSVQLCDTQRNNVIWSHTFVSRIEGAGLMKEVDDITTQIVSSLAGYTGIVHSKNIGLNGNQPPISNKLALAVFWSYNYLIEPSRENCLLAIAQLEKSLDDDADSALGWAVLAHLYSVTIIHNFPLGENTLAKAHEYVQHALTLNANNQHAYLALGLLHLLERNREEAIQCLEKVDSINPNSSYFNAIISQYMAFLGEFEKSSAFLERALRLNPLPFWWLNIPLILIALKNYEYEKMLFHASKIGQVSIVFEQVFEMIALYYLEDYKALKPMLKGYRKKYPFGLGFVKKMLSDLVFDEKLKKQIVTALQAIRDMD